MYAFDGFAVVNFGKSFYVAFTPELMLSYYAVYGKPVTPSQTDNNLTVTNLLSSYAYQHQNDTSLFVSYRNLNTTSLQEYKVSAHSNQTSAITLLRKTDLPLCVSTILANAVTVVIGCDEAQ